MFLLKGQSSSVAPREVVKTHLCWADDDFPMVHLVSHSNSGSERDRLLPFSALRFGMNLDQLKPSIISHYFAVVSGLVMDT